MTLADTAATPVVPAHAGTADGGPAPAPTASDTSAAPAAPAVPGGRQLRHTPALDGVRALAVLVVVVHHLGVIMWAGKPERLVPGGQVGLDLFFALSGFLITALLLGEYGRTGGIRVGNFLRRRVLRLLPALVALMAGLLAATLVTDRYTPRQVLSSAAWVLTFSTNIGVDKVIIEVGHTWSLSVEAHFYVLWCLVAAPVVAFVRRPYPVLAALAVVGILTSATLRALAYESGGDARAFDLYVGSLYRMDAPLMGALAGVAWVAGWLDRVPARLAAWAGVAALAGIAYAAEFTTPLSPGLLRGLYTAVAALCALLVLSVQVSGPSVVQRLFSLKPLVLIGTVSYSVYLWHLPVMFFVERNAGGRPLAQRVAAALVATAILSVLSYRFVELPFLRRKAKAQA